MKRILIASTGTVAGVLGLIGLKAAASQAPGGLPLAVPAASTRALPSPSAPSPRSATVSASRAAPTPIRSHPVHVSRAAQRTAAAAPAPSVPAQPAPVTTTVITRYVPAPVPTTSAPTVVTVSLVGPAVQTFYGVVQVKLTVTGHRIDSVGFAQLTAVDATSQYINSQAAPILLRETIAAQSAHIDGVSGASYTSAGYEQSLQAALDSVGIR